VKKANKGTAYIGFTVDRTRAQDRAFLRRFNLLQTARGIKTGSGLLRCLIVEGCKEWGVK